ncbi:MAG: phosphatidate cytidylyltransferase, partial [Deinococcales bacterium]
DVGAYTIGGLIGKRKLAPEISPSKTLEGSLGGLFCSALMLFLMQEAIRSFIPDVRIWEIWLFAILVSSAAQLGDLAESVIKRSLGAKDSGTFLPGHGGLLDRLDSLLFVLPVAYYFLSVAVFS